MNISATFETNAKTTEVVEPGMCTLDHPAIPSQAAAMLGSAPCNNRLDATFAQRLAMRLGIVAAISKDRLRLLQRQTALVTQRRDGIYQRQQLRDIMAIRTGQNGYYGNAVGVGRYMVLGTWSRAISGVRSCFSPAPTARIDEESTTTREKSIWSAALSLLSRISCSRSQTPASCQSRKRRQQVTPEPQPISAGKSRQRRPVLSTNRIPVNAARSGTGLRPGFFSRRGFGGGSSGSISVHSASSTIGLPISSSALSISMPKSSSLPEKLTAPSGLYETVS